MKNFHLLIFLTLSFFGNYVAAQEYDIVIKGGHVIDAKNDIDAVMDVAIKDGKIAKVAKNIDAKTGRTVGRCRGVICYPWSYRYPRARFCRNGSRPLSRQ